MNRERWAIRVTYTNGQDAWLRHGSTIGEGPIVKFTRRGRAEREAAFVREGLEPGDVATVVRFHRGLERSPSDDAPPAPQRRIDEHGDWVCEHGTAMDVHCCNCHSGFQFDIEHLCPDPPVPETS